jgi:hypothetical protein
MRSHNGYEYGRREYHRLHEDESSVLPLVLAAVFVCGGISLLSQRLHLRISQLVELSLYVACLSGAAASVVSYLANRKNQEATVWPHPPVFVPMLRDCKHVSEALQRGSTLMGYDPRRRPWFWSDEARRMQSILIGQSGSGKTTLLHNIVGQDISRSVAGRSMPLIVFDGKGDREFLQNVLHDVCAAGRLHDLRILDPFRPEISARFNPLYGSGDSRHELVNAFFDSFSLRQDFFRAHQATYLSDVCRVLHYAGAIYNIPDVLVMARDELVMKEQIAKAKRRVQDDASLVSGQRRQNFEMSVRNLLQSLEDRERVPKIQGLLNELMTFAEDELSVITNAYDDLLTLDEVIERGLILFVSLNTNKNSKAVTALGRMLLQNLQLVVGERYLKGSAGDEPAPMVSVVLDEFAPFAHPNFAQLLQTARGSNVAFLFSVQSIPQLRTVSWNFADEVSSAPNTVMLLRTRDEETARYFLNASSRVTGQRKTMTVEKQGIFADHYREIGFGSVTEIERTRAVDYQIKNLPAGQMQVLTTDARAGTLHLHLHVRRPRTHALSCFEPVVFPRLRPRVSGVSGASLRFSNPELACRMGRIFAKNRSAW